MASHKSLLHVSGEPYPLFHFLTSQQVLSFLDKLVSSHLYVLVEQVASKDLFTILVVKHVGGHEEKSEGGLGHELHVLIVEEDVVVV